MGTTHEEIYLADSSDNVLMYFPITSTVEEVWGNALNEKVLPWDSKGPIAVDLKMWTGEIVIQGAFVSSNTGVDADFVADLRTLMGIPAPTVITARMQYNWLLEKLLTTAKFRLYYIDDAFRYSGAARDISAGHYPPVVPKGLRVIAEGPKDRLDFVLRMTIAQPTVRT